MCRSIKRVQNVERTTSSAEEDNWKNDRTQKFKKTNRRKAFEMPYFGQQRTNQIHHP